MENYKEPAVTPWEVEGSLDYQKLVERFGAEPLNEGLVSRLKEPMPPVLRRGMCFSHRDLDKWLDDYEDGKEVSVVTGRGPSNKMHVGHLTLYVLPQYFQERYSCDVYIPISDDEKFLVKEDLKIEDVIRFGEQNIQDILAIGFDPEKTYVYRDLEHTKIYREAVKVAKKINLTTAKRIFGMSSEDSLGKIFYPAMQTAHILYPQFRNGPHRTLVPIGIDQDPFLSLTRDVAEKFGFIKPAGLHKKLAPGLEGPKMSSSDNKTHPIWLSDDAETVKKKINRYAFSGGQNTAALHREKGGNTEIDVSFQYLRYMFEESDSKLKEIKERYESGEMLTSELKTYTIERINEYLERHRGRREEIANSIDGFMLK